MRDLTLHELHAIQGAGKRYFSYFSEMVINGAIVGAFLYPTLTTINNVAGLANGAAAGGAMIAGSLATGIGVGAALGASYAVMMIASTELDLYYFTN